MRRVNCVSTYTAPPSVNAAAAAILAGCLALALALPGFAQQDREDPVAGTTKDGKVQVLGFEFDSWTDYFTSDYFRMTGRRCGTVVSPSTRAAVENQADCSLALTIPKPAYAPVVGKYRIPTVVHIIEHTNGDGQLTNAQVHSQIDVMNEDFLAMTGTNGAGGTDVQIEFYLATTDPSGAPTSGITRVVNDTWFNDTDELQFKQALGWDTSNYLNIYTNTASGYLGYAYLPQDGVNPIYDGVVILWSAFGRIDIDPPYDLGRTATHEVGHYLGLLHTFEGYGCYTGLNQGDLIADTYPENDEHYSCASDEMSCGAPDNLANYMNYTYDYCMSKFTFEQARRIRCTLMSYRAELFDTVPSTTPIADVLTGFITGAAPLPPARAAEADDNNDGRIDVVDVVRVNAP